MIRVFAAMAMVLGFSQASFAIGGACTSTAQCEAHQYCWQGYCEDDGSCESNDDCGPDLWCVGGMCISRCDYQDSNGIKILQILPPLELKKISN